MTRRHLVCAFAATALFVSAASGTARAQGPAAASHDPARAPSDASLEEARAHYERAIELYNEDAFDAALVEIRRAYDIAPSYKMLYNIGHIQRARKDFASALQAFEQYLVQAKDAIGESRRGEVEKLISTLRTRVATVEIVCSVPAATITVDDVSVGETPLARPITVNPGRRKLVASKQGYSPATTWVEVAGTDARRVELVPSTLGTSPVAVAPPPEEGSRTPMIVAWSVTGGLAVATAVFGGIALSKSSDLDERTNRFEASATPDQAARDLDSSKSSMRAFSITTDVLAGLTLVSAITSIYFTVARPSTSKSEVRESAKRALDLDVGLGRLNLTGSF